MVTLQEKIDELHASGVLAKPEDVGVNCEYVSPSFLVAKKSGGHRLVTSFTELGQYIKPSPSLMPSVSETHATLVGGSISLKLTCNRLIFKFLWIETV